MKAKTICGFVLAVMFALVATAFVAADVTGDLPISINEVSANDVVLYPDGVASLAGAPEETIPVVVKFTADEALTDLKIKVWIEGYKSEISATTSRFDVVNESSYIKRLSLTLPSVEDMEDNPEGLTLYVRIYDKNDYVEDGYSITMQRDSYSIELLSVDMPTSASAGEIILVDVVLKNTGARESEDTFVTVTIPELGVSKKAYFGDLVAQDCTDDNCDKEDAAERKVYLAIPADAKSGDYSVEVKASNYDITATAKKVISITGLAPAQTNNTGTGQTGTPSKTSGISTSVIVLTVVLVIVFVVLLIVLIVLLTKKPSEKTEDFGETSYY
jgi:hypothetical protein